MGKSCITVIIITTEFYYNIISIYNIYIYIYIFSTLEHDFEVEAIVSNNTSLLIIIKVIF